MCCNKARSPAASFCNIGSTFCLGQMPGQSHPSTAHLSSTRAQLPKSVFNCLENGRLHPCNKGIRAIRKINGPGNDVNQIHHDWNSITYVHARPCTQTPPHTHKRLTQNTISDVPFHTNKNLISRDRNLISPLLFISQLRPEREDLRASCVEPVAQRTITCSTMRNVNEHSTDFMPTVKVSLWGVLLQLHIVFCHHGGALWGLRK